MLVDDKTAFMDEGEFGELLEYGQSLPALTTIGKRWKTDRMLNEKHWLLGEYIEHPLAGMVGIKW